MEELSCGYPDCPCAGNYTGYGSYTRSLICYTNGKVEGHLIFVARVECISCGHTHALLPSVIIPYSPFSFHFVISLLYDFITHKYENVAALCSQYDISVSTLYRIRNRFLEDKKLMLGIMNDSITLAESFLTGFLCGSMTNADSQLQAYFMALGTSFLQAEGTIRRKQRQMSPKPETPP